MRPFPRLRSRIAPFLLLAAAATLPACKRPPAAGAGGGPGAMAVQVVAIPVRSQPVSESISLVGSIAPNEMVEVQSEVEGLVTRIAFEEGTRVEKGQLLVALDETKLAAQLAESEANLNLARASFDRTRQLLEDKLISQQEYDQAAATFAATGAGVELKRRQLVDARILAPFTGIAGARRVSPGQVISRNSTITWVVDLATVNVEVNVPERYLGQMAVGRAVEFTVAAYPGETFRGEVFFVSPQLDAATRTALVKARIPNPDGRLRGGMFAGLSLTLQLRDAALVIPEPALVNNGDTTLVFALTATNTALMRPVKVGLRLAGKAEILEGLREGEQVVVEGIQKLRPGAPVKLAPEADAAPYLR